MPNIYKQERMKICYLIEMVRSGLDEFNELKEIQYPQSTVTKFENLLSALKIHKNQLNDLIEITREHNKSVKSE